MTDTFIRLTDSEGDAFYVRANQVDAVSIHPDYPDLTTVQVGGKRMLCHESVADIIDTLATLVIEVEAA